MSQLEQAIDSLGLTAKRIADERNELIAALQELLDATPTSCEDKALNEAQSKAENLLERLGRR